MRALLLALLVATFAACTAGDAPPDRDNRRGFSDITDRIADNPAHRRYGVAVRHVDGEPQAYVTGFDAPNQLLAWRDGALRDITPDKLKDPDTDAIGAAWCDIDSDGEEELYVLTTDTYGGRKRFPDKLYDNTDGSWKDLFQNSSPANRFAGRSVACHYSPDGYAFFVARYGGPMQLITESNGTLTDLAPRYDMDRVTGGRSVVSRPTDDGVDLFAGNERGANHYYERRRHGYNERAAEYGIDDPLQNARGVSTIDLDQDGVLDLALGNWEGPHRLYRYKDSAFTDDAPSTYSSPTRIRSVVSADFNNDGSPEIFMNNIGEPNSFHAADGRILPIGDARETNGYGTGAAYADFDQDGTLELLISHGEQAPQPLTLYKIPTENNATTIRPQMPSGAPARNAKVTVHRTGEAIAIDGGSAYLNQMSPVAHTGVPPPVNATVRFPNGTTKTTTVTSTDTIIQPDKE